MYSIYFKGLQNTCQLHVSHTRVKYYSYQYFINKLQFHTFFSFVLGNISLGFKVPKVRRHTRVYCTGLQNGRMANSCLYNLKVFMSYRRKLSERQFRGRGCQSWDRRVVSETSCHWSAFVSRSRDLRNVYSSALKFDVALLLYVSDYLKHGIYRLNVQCRKSDPYVAK